MTEKRTAYSVACLDGKFLMVFNPKRNGWEMPGGHVEEGETSEQAAIREFMEESGYEIDIKGYRDLGYCDVFAAVLLEKTSERCEMTSELFSNMPDKLSFGREEYEDVIPWALSIVSRL